jgi:putative ABC transport system permease protein
MASPWNTLRSTAARLTGLFRVRRLDGELSAELESHLQLHIEDNLRAGMSPSEARRVALIKLGGVQQTVEAVRDGLWLKQITLLANDVRFSVRQVRNSPRFFLTSVFTLALGVSSAAVVFSLLYNAFLSAVPYKNAGRIVVASMDGVTNVGGWKGRDFFSPQEFLAFKSRNHCLEDLAGIDTRSLVLDNGQTARLVPAAVVTPNYFVLVGAEAALGRAFAPEDSVSSFTRVFVISDRLWHAEFQSSSDDIGRTFIVDGAPRTLVAVMSPRFLSDDVDLWMPSSPSVAGAPWFSLLGRAKSTANPAIVSRDLDAIAHRVQIENPSGNYPDRYIVRVRSARDAALGGFRETLMLLTGAVFLLLFIVSGNLANLLLARATSRQEELSVRIALGAGRYRILRQLSVEALLLASAACSLGVIAAYGEIRLFAALMPRHAVPAATVLNLDWRVFCVAAGITLLVVALCSVVPAFHALKNVRGQLASAQRAVTSSHTHIGKRSLFVGIQFAISFVLLAGSGSLLLNFLELTRANFGFDPAKILYLRPFLPQPEFASRQKQNVFTRDLLQRMQSLPGVISTSESMLVPPLGWDWSDTIIPGRPHIERWSTKFALCSSGFFSTFGLSPILGRVFNDADIDAERRVAVVSSSFAQTYFPGEYPIGKLFKLEVLDRPFLDVPHDAYFEIIGTVQGIPARDDSNLVWERSPQVFLPYGIQGFSHRIFFAKTAIDPHIVLKDVQREMRSVDARAADWSSGIVAEDLGDYYRRPRFELFVVGAFAAVGGALAIIGVFSVTAYAVSLRTHEFGIRCAIGASQSEILLATLRQAAKPLLAGLCGGILISLLLSRLHANGTAAFSSVNTCVLIAAAAGLLFVGLLAAFLPARRASRVDPMAALRYE